MKRRSGAPRALDNTVLYRHRGKIAHLATHFLRRTSIALVSDNVNGRILRPIDHEVRATQCDAALASSDFHAPNL